MKRRFKLMNHQIEQLKEEITSKDHSLVNTLIIIKSRRRRKSEARSNGVQEKDRRCSKDASKYDADVKDRRLFSMQTRRR